MTPVSIRILAFAALASLPLLAQQPASSPQPSTGSSSQVTTPQQTNPEQGASQTSSPQSTQAPGAEASAPTLSPVTGELESKLDTKDAKSGDSVVVKTTQAATFGNGVEIPMGSEIMGHIIDVAPKGQNGENARVTIQFDQAQLKGGQNLPIRSVIESVAPPGTAAGAGAGAAPSATTAPSSSPATGSGSASQPSTDPSQPAAGAAPAPGTVVATKGNLTIKTTAIPGVLLIGDVNGRPFSNAAGALLGAKQDVHLDNGTVMVVAIMSAPPAVGAK